MNRTSAAARIWVEGAVGCDADLLERYRTLGDEAAFAALLRRHGAMVLAICERILRCRHDAEDAFQATFLELLGRRTSLPEGPSYGGWLCTAARHRAINAKRSRSRRSVHEERAARIDDSVESHADWPDDAIADLILEVGRLASPYREAVVLCDLQGRSRSEAARLAGVPVGTISGRLTVARRMLRERLERHGSAVCLVGIGCLATAAPPSGPIRDTLAAAASFAAAGRNGSLTSGGLFAMAGKSLVAAGAVAAFGLSSWLAVPTPTSAAPAADVPAAKAKPEANDGVAQLLESRTWAIVAVDAGKGTLGITDKHVPPGGGALAGFMIANVQIQIAGAAPVAPPPPPLDPLVLSDLKLSEDATVVVDGRPAKIAEVRPGMVVALAMKDGLLVKVHATTSPAQPGGYTLKAVDLEARRVTLTLPGNGGVRELTLAKNAKAIARTTQPAGPNGQPMPVDVEIKLEDLKDRIGSAVSVQCEVESGTVVVRTLQTN